MTTDYTPHYGIPRPQFDSPGWSTGLNNALTAIDALIYDVLQASGVVGVWDNSTAYEEGDRAVDEDNGRIFTCLVAHTSTTSGTFADDRASNPTYWAAATLMITARGEWANDTVYNENDWVYDSSEGVSAICTTSHTSSSAPDDIRDDVANWDFLIDLAAGSVQADAVVYDNSSSGLSAADAQAAIDELDASIDTILTTLSTKANLASPTFTGNPAAPTQSASNNSTRLATTAFVQAVIAANPGFSNATVRVASTANVAIASELEDGDTLDGVTLATGDFVLLKDQTSPAENGIYTVPASGAASRTTAYNTWDSMVNVIVNVTAGTANADTSWRFTQNSGGTLESTSISLEAFGAVSAASGITVTDSGGYFSGTNVEDVLAEIAASIVGQQTMWIPAGSMQPTTTNGAAVLIEELTTNDRMVTGLAFDDSTRENACFDIQMPKGWNEGTLIWQAVWKCGVTTGNVIFGLEAVATANDNPMDTAYGTAQEITDGAGSAANDSQISPESSALTVAGSPGAEELVGFKVYRDAADGSDTLSGDAVLIGIKIHYTTDTPNDS